MNIWHDINEKRITPESFTVCIEIKKGSKKKYELDKETGLLMLDRVLYTSTHYPASYGFIPRTYADDYDPLDVLVLCQEPIDPMTLVKCYPIGVIRMFDSNQMDEKIIAVVENDPAMNCYKDIKDIPEHLAVEISHFFKVYKQLEGKKTYVIETLGNEQAKQIIAKCIQNYKEKFVK